MGKPIDINSASRGETFIFPLILSVAFTGLCIYKVFDLVSDRRESGMIAIFFLLALQNAYFVGKRRRAIDAASAL